MNYPGDGGSEKYVFDIIRKYGKENCIFVSSLEGPLQSALEKAGVKCYKIPMKNPFDLKAAILLKELVAKENISVIHTHFLRENYIAIIAKLLGAKVKVFWTYHVNVPMSPLNRLLNKFMTRNDEKVIAVSHFVKGELIKKGIPENKIVVIHNGIDLTSDFVSKDQTERSEKIQLATIGRLSPEKGQLFLLEGLKLLNENTSISYDWECLIFGNGPLKKELENKVQEYGLEQRVNFCGYVENIPEQLKNIDIVVIPSQNDAFPYIAIESLAMGKAIIGTNVGGIPEIVKNGETGIIIHYGNSNELLESLLKLFNDGSYANQLSQQARNFYLNHLTIDKMFNQINSLYNK
jgi:L-malate glycosyltransferase